MSVSVSLLDASQELELECHLSLLSALTLSLKLASHCAKFDEQQLERRANAGELLTFITIV